MNIALPVSAFVTQIRIYIYEGLINIALVCACDGYIFLYLRPVNIKNLLEIRAP